MSEAYGELVRAVQSLCLVSADDGTGPDEWTLTEALKPFVKAVLDEAAESARQAAWERFEPQHDAYQNGSATVHAVILPQHIWIGAEEATRAVATYPFTAIKET